MFAALSVGLLTACGPKPAGVEAAATPTTPDPPVTETAEALDSREVWGGFNGFMVFAIEDATTRAGLGAFAVMDNPNAAGSDLAALLSWTYGNQREAWEWEGAAWPAAGFILDPEPNATRGTATINELDHALFPIDATPFAPIPGAALYRLERFEDGQQGSALMGWLQVETDPAGALLSLTWIRHPSTTQVLIHVDSNHELHVIPEGNPGAVPPTARIIHQQPQ